MSYPRPRNANPKAAFSADASCIGQAWCGPPGFQCGNLHSVTVAILSRTRALPLSSLTSIGSNFLRRSFWYQVGCFNGCMNCTGTGKYLYPKESDYPEGCELAEPTNNDPATRSWDPHGKSSKGDFTKYNPWRSPGKAPVRDSCGAHVNLYVLVLVARRANRRRPCRPMLRFAWRWSRAPSDVYVLPYQPMKPYGFLLKKTSA